MVSALQEQRDIILDTIKNITRGDWKVLVIDETVKKILDNVVKEDDILRESIANIERIEERREMNPEMDAIYLLSPQAHIVDCLMADFERRRYRKSFLVWTALLDPQMRRRIDSSRDAQEQIGGFETLSIDYFPRESHLITFRDPWSFPILYHPVCSSLVREHMSALAQKIIGICISLGEMPKVRYYRPRNPLHEASVLCSHLANFVQEELDAYAQWNPNFPPQTNRPQSILVITDRAMDVVAPLIHEFTYQAMAHDLLPIRETDKVYYKTVLNKGDPDEQEKEMEIGEKDKVWVEMRHKHMKDTIEQLMKNFNNFLASNPNLANSEQATSLNAIKDMLAGLPEFQETKDEYSLHLNMATEVMAIFAARKLPDVASVEQILATGLDEDLRKPKNVAEQLVRLLDDEAIGPSDRLRLIILYLLFREGAIQSDIEHLLAHASLPPQNAETITNLHFLGGHTRKETLKEVKPLTQPLFPRKTVVTQIDEEYALSRFEPNLKLMLDEVVKGTLDQGTFPYVKPSQDNEELAAQAQVTLRSKKPTWAQNRSSTVENRQRIIVFMAGGATYSESRACYEVGKLHNRDIFLATSHMLTPALFIRQLNDLSVDRRRLDLPADRPKPKAPDFLFKRNDPVPRPAALPAGLGPRQAGGLPGMRLPKSPNATLPSQKSPAYNPAPVPPTAQMASISMNGDTPSSKPGKLEKKSKPDDEKEKKKKHGFFRSKK